MILAVVVFLGGVLTILSPCILPVLPFVFARSEQRFLTSGLPLLGGMAATFTAIATLAAVGGAWVVRFNQYGRVVSLVLLCAFAATLLSRTLADWLSRPFVALGNRLVPSTASADSSPRLLSSVLLGVATGLLWAPCAGPILGLVLTGAALSGPNGRTTLLLFAYAAGAATSLGVAILAGGRVFAALKRSLGAGEWVRRCLGIAVLIGVVAIAFGWDTTVLTRLSLNGTNRLEQTLIDAVHPGGRAANGGSDEKGGEAPLPSLAGATAWLNGPPLTAQSLHGKVVLIDFWTYSCINCLRSLPHVKAWFEKYKDHGLIVIGVHAPEFAFEKDLGNVRRAVADLAVTYPVALDNEYAIWKAFDNHYWPAHYFLDANGILRGHHFGEGDYAESERQIRELLVDAGYRDLPPIGTEATAGTGVEAASDMEHLDSPETYLGYKRAQHFASPGGFVSDRPQVYAIPSRLALNEWALGGQWTVDPEKTVLDATPGRLVFYFDARDLHLVLGPGPAGKSVRFRVLLDGAAPGANHGADIDAEGNGVIDGQRLYQLIRQSTQVGAHLFSIEFPDGEAAAYAFTFG